MRVHVKKSLDATKQERSCEEGLSFKNLDKLES